MLPRAYIAQQNQGMVLWSVQQLLQRPSVVDQAFQRGRK